MPKHTEYYEYPTDSGHTDSCGAWISSAGDLFKPHVSSEEGKGEVATQRFIPPPTSRDEYHGGPPVIPLSAAWSAPEGPWSGQGGLYAGQGRVTT